MGLLTSLGLEGRCSACSRRRPGEKTAPAVCPISGKSGFCPVSGKAPAGTGDSKAKGPKPGRVPSREEIARAAEHKEKGNVLFKQGKLEEAVSAYNDALQLTERDPSLWLNRSIVHRQLKRWEEARDDADIASGLEPSNAKAHYSLALSQQQLGQLKAALSSCEAGLKAEPENKALLQLRGVLKHEKAANASAQRKVDQQAEEEAQRRQAERQRAAKEADAKKQEDDALKCPVSRLGDGDLQEIKDVADSYQWQDRQPGDAERAAMKETLVDLFRNKYQDLKRSSEEHSNKTTLNTDQYEKEQKLGLQLTGGHRPMRRPDNVALPDTFRQPLGVLSVDKLAEYSADNLDGRYILSVYGNLFDVSDRPDKYGPEGPYASLTGKDITWGLFAGVDTEDFCNKFYDLFKAKDMGKDKLAGLCSWWAWYETEYGKPIGLLEPFTKESELPAPPLEELQDRCLLASSAPLPRGLWTNCDPNMDEAFLTQIRTSAAQLLAASGPIDCRPMGLKSERYGFDYTAVSPSDD